MVPVSSTEPDDWAAVRQWWPELGTPSTAALIPALTTACRSLLWRASPDLTELNARVDLTVKKGLADSLLSRLIEQPDSVALGRGLSAAGQLLCTWMADESRPGDFPLTLAALPGNPALACELAALIALSPNRGKGERLDDLRRAMPRLMAPFAELSGKTTHPVSIDTIAMLASARLSCPVALLRVADDAQRLRHVLPGFTEWISTRANLNPPGYTYFAGELEKLTVRHADEAADADLALLHAGRRHDEVHQDLRRLRTCQERSISTASRPSGIISSSTTGASAVTPSRWHSSAGWTTGSGQRTRRPPTW